ncbi:hypothetical protein ABZY57_24925 [Streptomyces sp. NPDC006450]|uniref:hypothetical protein n=1 Tax=Streptomyces sp. NPDC006450 TaxID=3155458 RepID=UPI0033B48D85
MPPPPGHPPLTGAEVAQAERELGIRFPPAYRSYSEGDEFEDRGTAGSVVLRDNGCGFATLLPPDWGRPAQL